MPKKFRQPGDYRHLKVSTLKVKQCIHVQLIKGPLAHIYNVSLNSGVFRDEWKTAEVKLLYKKGDSYDMLNYRPISIIPVFAKLLERLMYNRIISFLYDNKIFTEAQNGFRKSECIETAVQPFIEMIHEALDKRVHAIGIFIDLTKAYDILNHKLLLEKLFSYGIRGSKNSWFRCIICMYLHIHAVRNTTINRWYHYVICITVQYTMTCFGLINGPSSGCR